MDSVILGDGRGGQNAPLNVSVEQAWGFLVAIWTLAPHPSAIRD